MCASLRSGPSSDSSPRESLHATVSRHRLEPHRGCAQAVPTLYGGRYGEGLIAPPNPHIYCVLSAEPQDVRSGSWLTRHPHSTFEACEPPIRVVDRGGHKRERGVPHPPPIRSLRQGGQEVSPSHARATICSGAVVLTPPNGRILSLAMSAAASLADVSRFPLVLHRRARHRAVGAEYTAVTGLGRRSALQPRHS